MSATILLVEDNPITRKLVRFTLENQQLTVLEAPDAATALELFPRRSIALVLQDLCLPDMDGFELVQRLRELPGAADIPILLFSGMLSVQEEARVSSAGFDDVINKPVEPSRLVQIVRAYLPPAEGPESDPIGRGRRIVVADDDAVQRKLVAFRMQKVGFEVHSAADGREAMEQTRRVRPHAVLSDVLMPRLDGFALCLELRKDPALASIPVVLMTNSYVEPTDRDLARKAGAHDLVLRTPELREVLVALRASLAGTGTAERGAKPGDFEHEHTRRMMRQLERQVTLNARVNQRCALLTAEMTVLKGIAEALARHADIDEALRHTLAACFDAAGISLGFLYLNEGEQLRVISFGFSQAFRESDLLSFFEERPFLEEAIRAHGSTLIVSDGSSNPGQRMLARAGVASALIVPISYKAEALGALVMLSKRGEPQSDDRAKFGEAVAGQISQALAVTHAFREKERLERTAREQAAILSSVLESIGDGVAVVDGNGKFIVWNSAASPIVKMGLEPQARQGAGGAPGIFDVDTVTPMPLERVPLVRAMRGESHDGVEMFVRHEHAPKGVWLSVSGRPWRDDFGVARGGVAVFRDVTREKATQTQLLISDRMASVGMLAAGVAHEINNPLACVLGNLELSQLELEEREAAGSVRDAAELRDMMGDARHAADRVRQIVRDLKIFSRHEDVSLEAVELEPVLESSLRMAWNEIRHRARIVKNYAAVPVVKGSESRLGQVFLNLIVNAAQAIPEGNALGNTIRIETKLDESGGVAVTISDTGCGIAAQDLEHLFRPFYTTKAPGLGTGLGLAISHRIISDLGGTIQVESQLQKGTTFRVVLPVAQTSETAALPPNQLDTRAPRRARILAIDDEPMIVGLIRRTLAKEHEVVSTLSAKDALERIARGERFDVILCDLMMPQVTGVELHGELCKLGGGHADRIVFLTGGAFTPAARAFLDSVPNPRMEKPFDAQRLRAVVNEKLR